jgi:hypothetical protein
MSRQMQLKKLEPATRVYCRHIYINKCVKNHQSLPQAIHRLDLFGLSQVNYIVYDLWTVPSCCVLWTVTDLLYRVSYIVGILQYRSVTYPVLIYRQLDLITTIYESYKYSVCLYIVQQIRYNLDSFLWTAAYVKVAFYTSTASTAFRYDTNEL